MKESYVDYVVYVLWSSKYQKRYIGMTSNLIERFKSHNLLATKGWAIRYRPWEVIFIKFFTNKIEAMKFEKYLKSGIGRKWLNENIFDT